MRELIGALRAPDRSIGVLLALLVLAGTLVAAGMLSAFQAVGMIIVTAAASSLILAWQRRGTLTDLGPPRTLEHALEGSSAAGFAAFLLFHDTLPEPVGWCVAAFAAGCTLWAAALVHRRVAEARARA